MSEKEVSQLEYPENCPFCESKDVTFLERTKNKLGSLALNFCSECREFWVEKYHFEGWFPISEEEWDEKYKNERDD